MAEPRPLVPDVWWTIITKREKPLTHGGEAVMLFPTAGDASGWMMPTDLRVEKWDGVVLGLRNRGAECATFI